MENINIVITAGGTSEEIDKVRRITNTSTGRLGIQILSQALKQHPGAKVFYICSEYAVQPEPNERVEIITANGVMDVKKAIEDTITSHKIDYFIHLMAISDYMVGSVTNKQLIRETMTKLMAEGKDIYSALDNPKTMDKVNKISSDMDNLVIIMNKSPKLISLIKDLSPETFLVGFKLLDRVPEEELITVGHNLLKKNHCELVLANDLNSIREGVHTGHVIYPDKSYKTFKGKDSIATNLIDLMLNKE